MPRTIFWYCLQTCFVVMKILVVGYTHDILLPEAILCLLQTYLTDAM